MSSAFTELCKYTVSVESPCIAGYSGFNPKWVSFFIYLCKFLGAAAVAQPDELPDKFL